MPSFNRQTTGAEIVAEYGANAKGKTILVTGPSSGGLVAELLTTLTAASPAYLILAGRNEAKILPVIAAINKANPSIQTTFLPLDLLDNESMRKTAAQINETVDVIDVLINNAGVIAKKQFALSKDGIEALFAAKYLGHFLLTNLVAGKIFKAGGVVVNVSSMAYLLADAEMGDVNFDEGKDYHGWIAYARSKTANILFTYALAEKYGGELKALVIDPGSNQLLTNSDVDEAFLQKGFKIHVDRTKGVEVPETVLVTMEQGIATLMIAALDPTLEQKAPAFLKECNIIEPLPYAKDQDVALKLWALSEKLVDEQFT
ncbi:short-chain dehydrogenase [Dendryphion nanum]|uniref:Short-chain dehydrogenase n=1 Tax=Dendryphion nanum TaxID=256645 RepID=A0A9P9DNA8_9PLEO|nr:short-chain dehydrogenase [Dendryphion nanum]